jgi:hypothetical protein
MIKKAILYVWAVAVAVALAAIPIRAGSVLPNSGRLDFGSGSAAGPGFGVIQHSGGSVNFTQGFGNALYIKGAPIYQLLAPYGSHGPSKNGLYSVTNGSLNLTTGGCDVFCTTLNSNGFQGVTFKPGGSMSITGDITALGITTPGATLIAGHFVELGGNDVHLSLNTKTAKKNHSTGGLGGYLDITYLNPDIVAALHLPSNEGEGFLTQFFIDISYFSATHSWTGDVKSSDLIVVPTPEPTNLLLLGSALLIAAWITTRLKVRVQA